MTRARTAVIVVPILVAIVGGLFYGNRQFEQLGRRIDDLRGDMNARFAAVDGRFAEIHAEMRDRFGELHQDLREMRGLR